MQHLASPRSLATGPSFTARCPRRTRVQPSAASQAGDSPQAAEGPTTRRGLLLSAGLLAAAAARQPLPALAEDSAPSSSRRAFFDISVDGRALGRVVVEVFPDAGLGGQRFLDLAQGKDGVGYRRTRFDLLQDCYIAGSGVRALSRRASGATAIAGGYDIDLLADGILGAGSEGRRLHDGPGLVSLEILNQEELASREKLVAVKGKLIKVTEIVGNASAPNGTAFAITLRAEPILDSTNLVIGRLVEGQAVVDALAALPRVPDNTSSPFFQAGKRAGDKRADVAERSFGKPYAKVVIDACGLL